MGEEAKFIEDASYSPEICRIRNLTIKDFRREIVCRSKKGGR